MLHWTLIFTYNLMSILHFQYDSILHKKSFTIIADLSLLHGFTIECKLPKPMINTQFDKNEITYVSCNMRLYCYSLKSSSHQIYSVLIDVLFILQQEDGHSDWVSCVRFSPNTQNPIIVSCGWDKTVKVIFYSHTKNLLEYFKSYHLVVQFKSCECLVWF